VKKKALDYHSQGRPGKIKVVPTKPTVTSEDLSLAYSPGVAEPCREIAKDPEAVFKYTAKGNLVAVVSNGTAVLGLGNLGPLAGKPVMEGKGVLFKRFADVDVFDIEIASEDPLKVIEVCQLIAPTFGGINLEDIRAPECFEIERILIDTLDIPVFHDDQHGTAIISCAALLNAIELVDKKISEVRIVFSGAGASAIACAKLYKDLGVKEDHILMVDSKGVLHDGRADLNVYKQEFKRRTEARTLSDAMKGCDVFVGLSSAGLVTPDMVKAMGPKPIIFAMANPDPEITPDEVASVRDDAIMATGRSDYPNQVNNVLGFPFIFRGALDVRARKINEAMKQAAVRALAALARLGESEEIPQAVRNAYPGQSFEFGRNNIIPKPFDPRVLLHVAPAVAQAAIETGVARVERDMDEYRRSLEARVAEISRL
jgi:malate dehydrogenase (oxaloacetate-decarboxylating)(NADP+)